MSLANFLSQCAESSYPEPRSEGHTLITGTMLAKVAPMMKPGGMALDVGCGAGPALEWFEENNIPALGITVNESDLMACRNLGFTVAKHDQNSMDLPNKRFALVWARHVLEHSICPMWTLREYNRVLEDGGILYVEVPGPDTPCFHETNANHYSVLGWKAWHSLIGRSGFEIVEAAQIDIQTPLGGDRYFYFIARKQ